MLEKFYDFYGRHRNLSVAYHVVTGKLYRPSHLKIFLYDLMGKQGSAYDDLVHIEAALRWLFEAQDANGVGGVSASYSLSWGWRWPYPETSGYITPTLFDFARFHPNSSIALECRERALKIADWLVDIQMTDGGYRCGFYPVGHGSLADKASALERATAFETGQVLAGLGTAYSETGEHRYLESAVKAGNWLVENQSPDGSWWTSRQKEPRSYDSFVAWPMAALWQLAGEGYYRKAAIKNLDWCLAQQKDNGYFDNCSHTLGESPLTHGIGYAVQGLLETGFLLKESKYVEAAQKTADALLEIYSSRAGSESERLTNNRILPARFDESWGSRDKFSCLTGNAQISLIWSKLYLMTRDIRYLNGAQKINQDLKKLQNLTSANSGIRGGIKGSHPIYGLYMTFQYPNWAAKFFIDALIAEEQALDMLKG